VKHTVAKRNIRGVKISEKFKKTAHLPLS